MIEFKCPKCGEDEVSVVERTRRKMAPEILLRTMCHICGHKFTMIFKCVSWLDRWTDEDDEAEESF